MIPPDAALSWPDGRQRGRGTAQAPRRAVGTPQRHVDAAAPCGGGALDGGAAATGRDACPGTGRWSREDRSWVGLVAQAGIRAFTTWFANPSAPLAITADVFGTAPRELTRSISLRQTLDLVRAVVDVVEDHIEALTDDPDDPRQLAAVQEAVLRYSREVAFAAAELYAQAAETRGAWDARLEALVVDALLRGDTDDALQSRVAALGLARARRDRGGRGRQRSWPRRAGGRRPAPGRPSRGRRRPGRRAGRPARRGAGHRLRPGCGRHQPRCPVRTGAGRGRPDRDGPARGRVLGARGPGGSRRGPRLAVGSAARRRRRPAARAGAVRRRLGPACTDRPRLPPPARGGPGRSPRRCRRTWRADGLSKAPPGPCSCTRTPCGTGCVASPTSRAGTRPFRATATCCRSPLAIGLLAGRRPRVPELDDPTPAAAHGSKSRAAARSSAGGRARDPGLHPPVGGILQLFSASLSGSYRDPAARTGGWTGAGHRLPRPGVPEPRLPLPMARGPGLPRAARLAAARSPASTSSRTAPRPTPTPSATPPSPSR